MDEPRRRARDEEIVAAVVQVILAEGTVSSQKRLAELVNARLKKRGFHVTATRIRVLAIRSGLVGIDVRTRRGGDAPDLEKCPVCHARLKRTSNRTLAGTSTLTGYKCTRCSWWTGRSMRVPTHYVFHARVSRAEGRNEQLAFTRPSRRTP